MRLPILGFVCFVNLGMIELMMVVLECGVFPILECSLALLGLMKYVVMLDGFRLLFVKCLVVMRVSRAVTLIEDGFGMDLQKNLS